MVILAAEMAWADYTALTLYLLLMLGMGVWFTHRKSDSSDYLLAGRKAPWFAVGVSLVLSLLSTYSIVMIPGEIFEHGVSLWVVNLLGPVLSIVAFYVFIRFYFKLGSFTPFEYLEYRYDSRVRLLISIIYLWGRMMYLAMVLFATSKVFEGGAGWEPWFTILLVGVIGIVYTVMGGMRAVIWTDVVQFVVLFVGLGFAVTVCLNRIEGGVWDVLRISWEGGRGPTRFTEPDFYALNPYVRLSFWLLFTDSILHSLTDTGTDQIRVQRLLSTRSYAHATRAIWSKLVLIYPLILTLWFVGFAIYVYYQQNPADPQITSGDTALFRFISTELPSPIPGLLFAAMLAAAMSTLDSGMNSLSAVWLKELHVKYLNPAMPEQRQVIVSRVASAVVGVFAVAMGVVVAETSEVLSQSVVEAQTIFMSMNVIIMPAFIFAVLAKRAHSRMIWTMTSLCWGLNFGMATWYIASKYGHTGAIPSWPIWACLAAAAGLGLFGAAARQAQRLMTGRVLLLISLLPVGYGAAMVFWYLMTRYSEGGQLSFQWAGFLGTALFLAGGTVWLVFSKPAPPERYWGLTLPTFKKAQASHPMPEEG